MADATTYGTVIRAISRGELDDVLDRIVLAIKERKRAAGRETLYSVRPGDKVALTGLRPAYLNGMTGTVTGTRNTRILVALDNPPTDGGRFSNGHPLAVPAACVTKREAV